MTINDCAELLNTIKEYDSYLSELNSVGSIDKDSYIAEDLRDAINLISGFLYEIIPDADSKFLKVLSEDDCIMTADLSRYLHDWLINAEKDINTLSNCHIRLDYDFERMMLTVEKCSEELLLNRIIQVLTKIAQDNLMFFERLVFVYNELSHLWGSFDPQAGNYEHFINGICAVKGNSDNIRWLYASVEDYRSRKVVYGLVKFWLCRDFDHLDSIRENNYKEYFDLDILKDIISAEEVFVDCGAFTGDTAEEYYDNFNSCKTMYLYDMVPANIDQAVNKLSCHSGIIYRNKGVGSPDQIGIKVPVKNTVTSSCSIVGNYKTADPETKSINAPEVEVGIVTLDEDINEKITFLKMDIEGSEINALLGAKDHILNDKPKLAICTYHRYEHLWEIPRLIHSMNPDYKLYLRYNGVPNGIMASEHIVYAIPKP